MPDTDHDVTGERCPAQFVNTVSQLVNEVRRYSPFSDLWKLADKVNDEMRHLTTPPTPTPIDGGEDEGLDERGIYDLICRVVDGKTSQRKAASVLYSRLHTAESERDELARNTDLSVDLRYARLVEAAKAWVTDFHLHPDDEPVDPMLDAAAELEAAVQPFLAALTDTPRPEEA